MINQHPVLLVAAVDSSEGLPPVIRRCFSHEMKMGPLNEEQRSQLLSESFQHISDLLPDVCCHFVPFFISHVHLVKVGRYPSICLQFDDW